MSKKSGKKEGRNGVCRVCGCTQDAACLGGCYWMEPDLCSQCASLDQARAFFAKSAPERLAIERAALKG